MLRITAALGTFTHAGHRTRDRLTVERHVGRVLPGRLGKVARGKTLHNAIAIIPDPINAGDCGQRPGKFGETEPDPLGD